MPKHSRLFRFKRATLTLLIEHSVLLVLVCAAPVMANSPSTDELSAVTTSAGQANYQRKVVDIPMRDGVTLHTVILSPQGAQNAPILFTRTPYSAQWMSNHVQSDDMGAILQGFDNAADVIVEGGYIRVIQDIRGRFASGGTFISTRPLADNPYNPELVDESTDSYDSINWLINNIPESNGKVGIIGCSYDGFTTLMALINPHPALKVSVPIDPMVDGWRGDDWFHNGAFWQILIAAIWGGKTKDSNVPFIWDTTDRYDTFMRAGSIGELGKQKGIEQVDFWQQIITHPAYDDYWQSQAMDKVLANYPLQVPMMLVAETNETDSDWVIKLIDVYPDKFPANETLAGYQFPLAMDIFRGRYRQSLSHPVPLEPNVPLLYQFALPDANHVFLPGHRIMVQMQSSWFPLYDRNPQSFMPNIFFAQAKDYVKATPKMVVAGATG